MDFTKRQASQWIAGDPVQSKIFDAAVDKVALSERHRHAKILWGGLAAIFIGAAVLGGLDGGVLKWAGDASTTPFDYVVSAGLGYSIAEFALRTWRHARADKAATEALSQVKGSREQIVASLREITGSLSDEFKRTGAYPSDAGEIIERARLAALAIQAITNADVAAKAKGPRPR